MPTSIRCRCGQVQGEADLDNAYTRATCYCKDCRANARWLGTPGLLDAQGGSDIVAMAPAGVRFASGQDRLACMSLSGKGILRWYAACCRTPLGNTGRSAKLPYVGVLTACFAGAPEEIDAAVGPRDRITLNPGSAEERVRKTPLGFATGGLRILTNMVVRRLRGEGAGPYFDASTGQPIRAPEVLTAAQRESLGANQPSHPSR